MGKGLLQKGFTLIELTTTMAVGGVLLAIGAPNMTDLVRDNRLATQSNELVTDLAYARFEAVRNGVTVRVCPSLDPAAAVPTCSGTRDWETGWIVWADLNTDGVVDAGEVLKAREALPGGTTLASAAHTEIAFQSTGFAVGFNDTLSMCDPRGALAGRSIVVSQVGRVTVQTGAGTCPA